jgi:hypothetical protein
VIPEIRIEVDVLLNEFHVSETAFRALLARPIERDLERRGIAVERMAKRIATGPPPSPPGQGPGVRTGRLRNSITHRLGVDAVGPYVDIGTAVLYGPYLELGTSRMQARPFLSPALSAARQV